MNNKKVISAVLLVSDGPIEHSYFEELLKIENTVLLTKKPVDTPLLKLLKLNKSVLPVKYSKVPNEADKNPIIDKNK